MQPLLKIAEIAENIFSLLGEIFQLLRPRQLVPVYSNIVAYQDLSRDIKRMTEQDIPCDYVMLSVNNTENVPADTYLAVSGAGFYTDTNQQIFFGFDGMTTPHQVFPVTPWPFLIPIENARSIFIRTDKKKAPATGTSLSYTCFKYVNPKTFDRGALPRPESSGPAIFGPGTTQKS